MFYRYVLPTLLSYLSSLTSYLLKNGICHTELKRGEHLQSLDKLDVVAHLAMNVLNVASEIYGIVGIVWVGFHTIVGDDFRVTTPEHHTGFQSHIKALSLVGVAAVATIIALAK